ncbi:MAG: GlmU family protein [Chloroflexota bacterium]
MVHSETVILFEDEGYRTFLPLVHSRPVWDLRCGIYSLRERVQLIAGTAPSGICRPHLAAAYGAGRWPLGLFANSDPLLFVNGRACHLDWLPDLQVAPTDTIYISHSSSDAREKVLLGAKLSPALASAVFLYILNQQSQLALTELQRFTRVVEIDTELLTFPWDIITLNGEQIARDVSLFVAAHGIHSLKDHPSIDPHVVIHNPNQVYIHPAAKLNGPLVLDARDGPIVIGAASIEPFSFIQGPTSIGDKSLIASARIRGETSIGPVCRIGGEVEASVIQGYSNKHHDGFLGHSYLGEWVNIGAMTTNSDLKNTYGTIRVVIDGLGQVDSGQLKLGCFLADHVKLGIGVHLNGGAVIGTGSNIFGVHFAPKTIPPFTWGGELFREYRIDRMIDVARKVMGRRKVTLSDEQERVLRDVFAMTRGSRIDMDHPVTTTKPVVLPEAEKALSEAETIAIQDVETVQRVS